MNNAKLKTSPRLKRVAAFLSDGKEHSTMEIALSARVCAVNSIVSELRVNGLEISCRRSRGQEREPIWLYKMSRAQQQEVEYVERC